jgi:hypothetical protein
MIGRNPKEYFFLSLLAFTLVLFLLMSNVGTVQTANSDTNDLPSDNTGIQLADNGTLQGWDLSPSVVYTHTIHLPLIILSEDLLPPWLSHFNSFRAASRLPLLTENVNWSNGGILHSRYMVKNDYVGHREDVNDVWYTPEGHSAAQNGNVFVSSWSGTSDTTAIDFWITAPFHAVSMLDPHLFATGFGSYHENIGQWKMGATLDVLRDRGALPPNFDFPVLYPGSGSEIDLLRYSGGEFPDPLSSCPGYFPPTGSPIIIQIGPGNVTPNVTLHELRETGGGLLAHCQYDETNYTNSDSQYQTTGRLVLGNRDAIVLMPRNPLKAGKTYEVTIVANGQTYIWSFSTSPTSSTLNQIIEINYISRPPRP